MDQEPAKILIVDDEEDIRELLYDRLEFMGHDVITATNGREGLEQIEAEKPDLVMLDIQMPELDGFGVLRGVAEKELDTTIIMITANGTIQRAVQAMMEGAFDFLLKPFQPRDVEKRVNRALENVQLERENKRLQYELEEAQKRLIEEMQGELQAAHDMQMALLPDQSPVFDGVDVAGTCIPARDVGGDYYTYFESEPGQFLDIVLADVAGKGMVAATVAMRFNEMLRYEAAGKERLPDILKGLDQSLRGRIPPELFVTCGIARLDVASKELSFATAACPDVFLYRKAQDRIESLGMSGLPLGLPLIIDGDCFQECVLNLTSGDVVLFSSDGIEEARDEHDAFFGEDRLRSVFLESIKGGQDAADIRDRLVAAVKAFVGDAPQTDDLTVVVLRIL